MAATQIAFNIGQIQCVPINDGTFSYPTAWMFSNVSQQQLEEGLRREHLPVDQVISPYTCLLVKTGKEVLLVDTGADGLAPTTGNLMSNLLTQGVKPEQITTVVLTHAHPDHIGGVVDADGKPAFSNARYVMAKTEWDFWTSNPDLHGLSLDEHVKHMLINCAQKNLPPLKARLELVDVEKEIAPGVNVVPAPGHTPGHIALVISSQHTQLVHLSDSVLHPLHMKYPAWRNIFDLDEARAANTRQTLLDRAAAENAHVLAYHFPFPATGTVTKSGAGWGWKPSA